MLASQSAKAVEKRQSPYFIDGLHCEGLESLDATQDMDLAYPDEVAEIGRKTRLQDLCESIFADGGVRKFQWVTPNDLERTTFILVHSKRFKSIAFRIEKSELQNHVHLIGRFELLEPRNFYKFSLSQAYDKSKKGDPRLTTKSEGAILINRRGSKNPAPLTFGYKLFVSEADDPLTLNLNAEDKKNTTLRSEELVSVQRPKGQYFALYSKYQQLNGVYAQLLLESSRLSGDSHDTANVRVELGTEFHLDPLSPSITRLSVLYATYTAKGKDFYEGKYTTRNSRSIAFAGFYQDIGLRLIKGHVSIYRSLTPELHIFGNVDVAAPLGRLFATNHALGVAGEYLRGAILPDQRFGLPDRNIVQYYYEAEKPFGTGSVDHLVALRLGAATYQAINSLDRPYSEDQGFAELAWKASDENFETSLALIYGNRRLY